MQNFVLVIEEDQAIAELCKGVLRGQGAKVVSVKDSGAAKRILIQSIPNIIIASLSSEDEGAAGFRLCEELQGRSDFAEIPILLVCEEIKQGYSERARELKADGLLSWPLTEGDFRNALGRHFSFEAGAAEFDIEFEVEQEVEPKKEEKPQAKPAPALAGDEKLAKAQKLLAQVLHALKTSDLLSVAEIEDVPRIVFEMTRSVCGQQSVPAQPKEGEKEDTTETSMDLDSVFGLKK